MLADRRHRHHTGLRSVNLGWKLAAMTEGWGGPALLASYEIERRPIAVAMSASRRAPTTPSPPFRLARGRHRLEGQSGLAVGARAHQAAIRLRRLADLRARRHAAGADGPAQFVPSTRPGTRAPHAWLDGERSTLDLSATASCCCGSAPIRPMRRASSRPPRRKACRCARPRLADPDVATLYETQPRTGAAGRRCAWRANEAPPRPWDR